MTFDGRFEEADGPGEAWAEQEFRRAGKDSGDAGVSAEPRGREEYYEALQAADSGEPRGDDGDGTQAQDADHADVGDDDERKQADDPRADTAENSDGHEGTGSMWDSIDAEERPPLEAIHVTPERKTHILDGDDTGGGHRHGTRKPGKTEFPANWSDAKALGQLQDVARHPDETPIRQDNGRWFTTGTREEIEIVALVEPDAQIWSGWPLPGGPGVVQNPRET